MSNTKVNHKGVAEEIYEYLTHEYKFLVHKHMTLEGCIKTLTTKLKRLTDHQVDFWLMALREIGMHKSDNAPTPTEIIAAIIAKSKEFKPVIDNHLAINTIVENVIDYEALWRSSNDQQKHDFFIDNRFHKVPPYIRYWFVKYNEEHRGWSPHESHMMIKYWALPFTHANDGAVINNQKEIMKYFRNRVDG